MSRRRIRVAAAALALLAVSAAPAVAQDWDRARDEAVEILRSMIRIDSSDPSTGGETKVVEYIRDLLAAEGIESRIYEMEPGRGNLVARIRGNGSKRPILLMGHIDVVGVEPALWSVDAFEGLVEDGYVWGRGAQDDKGMSAVALQVFIMLKRSGVELDRDVIYMANAGEEGSPRVGIEYMIREHFDEIDAEFALNEGGSTTVQGGRHVVGVATTEKVGRGMQLVARGTSGHGSRPRPDNPVVHLGAAVGKLGTWQPPMRLNATTREWFRRMAEVLPPEQAFLYRNVEDPDLTEMIQEKLRLTDFIANSTLRTSISPNIIEGGFRSNVIPGEATARLDIRALPDEDVAWLVSEMERVIDDPLVEIIPPRGPGRPVSPPMPMDSEMFRALENAQKSVFPNGITVPVMLTGATDSAQLRAAGVLTYGIGSVMGDEGALAHGNDERVSVEGVGQFVRFLHHVVTEVAGS